MNGKTGLDRRAAAWLADGPTVLADRVLDAALREVHVTHQRRVMRLPWRFRPMPAFSRLTGIAAVAVVVVVGAGGLIYLNSPGAAGPGGPAAPSPTATPIATPAATPTVAPSPQPTFDPTAWASYTSAVYGITIAYPADWSLYAPAGHRWQPDEPLPNDAWPYADVFANPEQVDGDSIGLWVWQLSAPAGADIASWAGLEAVVRGMCPAAGLECPTAAPPTTLCAGQGACQPGIMLLMGSEESPSAFLSDPGTGVITVIELGRRDDFPAASRYGGTIALLKAILAQIDVRAARPGETPR